MQRLPVRVEAAINKLYLAFFNDFLNPECCKQCAVGNILNNTDSWKHLSDDHGSLKLNYIGMVNESLGKRFNGYLPSELLQIEAIFLTACGYKLPLTKANNRPRGENYSDILFNGLEEVVKFLCQLDGIHDPMDISRLIDLKKYEICNG